MGKKEGDLLGGHRVGRHDQVTLVLATLVVYNNHGLTLAQRGEGGGDFGETHDSLLSFEAAVLTAEKPIG